MSETNKTFCRGEPTSANACVGGNGSPGYSEYSKGFSSAANLLIDKVLCHPDCIAMVDEFVYPVCFNMRHSVELRIKEAIYNLQDIAKIRGESLEFDQAGSHHIGRIWGFFRTESESIDTRYHAINRKIDPTIQDISQVDPTGQTFRYPFSNQSQKHLTKISIINFFILKRQFNSLEKELDALHELNTFLLEEYDLRSFTKNLPRNKLQELAHQLPPRSTWKNPDFKEAKNKLKDYYGIGERELSKAIDVIESHYEFAPIIGVNLPLKGVTNEEVFCFLEDWCKLHEIHADNKKPVKHNYRIDVKRLVEDIGKEMKIEARIWSKVSQELTPELLAGLKALYYFAKWLDYSENYIYRYEQEKKQADFDFSGDQNEVMESYIHVLHKTDAMDSMVKSLYFLKQVDLAERLVGAYDLDSKFSWLEKARTGELFLLSGYSEYKV